MDDIAKQVLKNEMSNAGFIEQEEISGLMKEIQNFAKINTANDLVSHKDCGDKENCDMCKTKSIITGPAFRKGLVSGIKLKTRFPTVNFNVS